LIYRFLRPNIFKELEKNDQTDEQKKEIEIKGCLLFFKDY